MAGKAPAGELMIRTIAVATDANRNGGVFGGWLMYQMDHAAGTAALRRAAGQVATASVERINFQSPVHIGDEVSFYAQVVSVGNSSMKIQVETWRRLRDSADDVQVATAEFTFVAIDRTGKPRQVPPESTFKANK